MVLAYLCPRHGQHRECDVSEGGERICPEAPDDDPTAVTGITGRTRKPNSDGVTYGQIRWTILTGYNKDDQKFVHAIDYEQAIDKALEKYGEDTHITEVRPSKRGYR
jgi:hypothetical protein